MAPSPCGRLFNYWGGTDGDRSEDKFAAGLYSGILTEFNSCSIPTKQQDRCVDKTTPLPKDKRLAPYNGKTPNSEFPFLQLIRN